MRQEIRIWCDYKELTPEQQDQAFALWSEVRQRDDIPWQDETIESLRKLLDHIGVKAKWSVGAYTDSWMRLQEYEWQDFSAHQAMSWWEENVLSPLRGPDGKVPECPFTGYYLDDAILTKVGDSLVEGQTLRQSIEGLAGFVQSALEDEHEWYHSRKAFSEDADDWEYRVEDSRIVEIERR
ncbi:MAG: hypothetical protein EBT03_11915 [Betaproteobacteria bacterium]|nr:hypothetical protein [Betaproteobacteria bacterium]